MNPNDQPVGLLANLRAGVVERLENAAAFAAPNPVPVVNGGRGDILAAVDKNLEQRTAGLCLAVTIPRMDPWDASLQGIAPTVSVAVIERPSENWSQKGRGRAIEDAAEDVFLALGFNDDGTPGWSPDPIWTRFRFAGFRQVLASVDRVVIEVLFATSTVLKAETTS